MQRSAWLVSTLLMCLVHSAAAVAWEGAMPELNAELRAKALSVLRDGLKSEEFWPAMHAAEALTLVWPALLTIVESSATGLYRVAPRWCPARVESTTMNLSVPTG